MVMYECDRCHGTYGAKLTSVTIGKNHYELCNGCISDIENMLLNPKFDINERVIILDKEDKMMDEGIIFRRIRFPENGDHFYHYDIQLDDNSVIGDVPENKIRRASEVNHE